ncbi:MAG: transposase [Desulfosalsimonas sp.]
MSGSARGTRENPGKNVKAKSVLNKSILNQAWSEFMRQLEYKLAWRGGDLVKISPRNTSQTCSACGHMSKNNRKSQSRFVCEECGLEINADHNAAINIQTLGQRGLACEANRKSGRQQEPSGNGDRVPGLAA